MPVKLKFHFPISVLEEQGNLILTAAESDTYSAALTDRLDPSTVPTGRGLWNGLFDPEAATSPPATPPPAGASSAQKSARSVVGTLTKTQKTLRVAYHEQAKKAREAAKKAFRGDDVKLHQEFGVSSHPPDDIETILSQGRLPVASVRSTANATDLKTKAAYIKKDADALATAFDNLAANESQQEDAKGIAGSTTDIRNTQLNSLYDIALLIQSAAKNELTDRAALAAFRIGIFPPKEKGGNSGGSKTAKPDGGAPISPPTKPTGRTGTSIQ